jgi:hypothetical protein
VSDFSYVFSNLATFNEPIEKWCVFAGTNFVRWSLSFKLFPTMYISPLHFWQAWMFVGASAFNQTIGGWDVSNGATFVSSLDVFESLKLVSSFVRSVKDTTVLTAMHISHHFTFGRVLCSFVRRHSTSRLAAGTFPAAVHL